MLVGQGMGRIAASYSAGEVSGPVVGGLVGNTASGGTVVASYSTASITPTGDSSGWVYGGLVGDSSGTTNVIDSYWDVDTSGVGSPYHETPGLPLKPGEAKSSVELQSPTNYTGIYANWGRLDLDGDGTIDTEPWNLGTESQYPYLAWQGSPPPAPPIKNDYDLDNDGLIEIDSLHQLFALRWDLDGDGLPGGDGSLQGDWLDELRLVYPDPQGDIGCDAAACYGYELATDLDFDSDGDGVVTAADDFWADYPWAGADPFETTPNEFIGSYGFEGSGWVPIGTFGQGFAGTLDGGGRVIHNLYIDGSVGFLGLFGDLNEKGVIRNLGVLNASVTNDAEYTGGIVSVNHGVISAVRFGGSVSSSTSNAVAVLGGLVGENWGRIGASYATGSVNGTAGTGDPDVGGLAGRNKGGAIVASYSVAAVAAAGSDAGGLVGTQPAADGGSTTNSYWDTEASGQGASGGGVGKTPRELQAPTGYTGIYGDWDDIDLDGNATTPDTNDLWRFGTAGQYPVLWWEAQEVAAGTTDYDADDDRLIEVTGLAQLDAMRWDLDGDGAPDDTDGVTPRGEAFPDAVEGMGCPPPDGCSGYELTSNLDFDTDGDGVFGSGDSFWDGGSGWNPVNGYNAVLEGNHYEIANLGTNRSAISNAGLFALLNADAVVGNVGLVNFTIANSGFGQGATAGALAGTNLGSISAVSVYGAVITTINGGGLVGSNDGHIKVSRATDAAVNGVTAGGLVAENKAAGAVLASYAFGTLANPSGSGGSAGGFVGNNDGSIAASYAGSSGLASYATSGGFAGSNAGTISNSYWDKTASGTGTGGVGNGKQAGVAGKTAAELQAPTDYTGIYADWDLDLDGDGTGDDPWRFLTSSDYPRLAWEVVARVLASPGKLELEEFNDRVTFEVRLATQPAGTVDVSVTSSNTGVVTVSPATLRFNASSWDRPQTVTVASVSDSVFTGGRTASITVAATGGGYDDIGAEVGVTVRDDDDAAILLDRSTIAVFEDTALANNTSTYGVRLGHEPTDTVTVTVTSGDTSVATVSPASITFSTANWDAKQTITVTGVDGAGSSYDRRAEIRHDAAGGGYDGQVAYVDVALASDDSRHIST